VLVFGGKCLQILDLDLNISAEAMVLPDMILECDFVDSKLCRLLLVGCAHNFIDIYSVMERNEFLFRVQNSFACVLFSMTFSINTIESTIQVASGTAFGKILIWDYSLAFERFPDHDERVVQDICKELTGHTGVVFRVNYNSNRSKVASVSDDRTVRVWSLETFSQIFIGWGHICRVWDVIFYREDEIITTGEECLVKVWNLAKGECVGSFQGHRGKSCWRVADVGDRQHIISVGNDSSVKIWDINNQLLSTPDTNQSAKKLR
jgi:WD40 repeat protein